MYRDEVLIHAAKWMHLKKIMQIFYEVKEAGMELGDGDGGWRWGVTAEGVDGSFSLGQ